MYRSGWKTVIFLCLLFMLVYNSTNWLAAHRAHVPTYYFQWERHIPFVPIFIIPYMSIDLFFIAAPFLCRRERERRTLSNRIVTGILIAGLCFLLFPLRFAFERPHVEGPLGVIFNNFRSFDQPFNQLPSLHITLRTILAVFYVHRFRGLLKWSLRIWFSLIGFSTVLTYQHHVIDALGGFALGALCIYFFADEPMRSPVTKNPKIGGYYMLVALVCGVLGFWLEPLGLILLWPAVAFAIASTAYFGVGPGIFRKKDGKLPPITFIILWPVLLPQRLSLLFYSAQADPWNELTDRVWIGRKLSYLEAKNAVDRGVTAVLDLTCEFTEPRPFRNVLYKQLAIMDLTAPTPEQLQDAIHFISSHSRNGIVYVHCKAGYSRTACVAGAYLLASGKASSLEQVLERLRAVRPTIVIRPEAMACLGRFPIPSVSPTMV
jgi:membrane-associated phospholipid phosphatase